MPRFWLPILLPNQITLTALLMRRGTLQCHCQYLICALQTSELRVLILMPPKQKNIYDVTIAFRICAKNDPKYQKKNFVKKTSVILKYYPSNVKKWGLKIPSLPVANVNLDQLCVPLTVAPLETTINYSFEINYVYWTLWPRIILFQIFLG